MKYTGFFKRLCAYLLDSIITYVPFVFVFGLKESYDSFAWGTYIALWTAYFVWMTGTYGATIGKMVMRIKVTKENGAKLNYSDALVREIASYLSLIVFCLGFFNIIWDKKKQGWHDKIAKTVVVKA